MLNESFIPFLEKRILSLNGLGCYLSTHDLIHLCAACGLTQGHKKRALLLQSLLLHVKNESREKRFYESLLQCIETKERAFSSLLSSYPKATYRFEHFMRALETTKHRLKHEIALHVKES